MASGRSFIDTDAAARYYFNDSSTNKVKDKKDIVTSGAYLLFYTKRDAAAGHKRSEPEKRGS